jgi:rubrerythrin
MDLAGSRPYNAGVSERSSREMTSMRDLLKNCYKIEDLARKIYQLLASHTSFAPEVRKVFQQLSDDERSHALQLDLLLQGTAAEIDASPMMSWEKLEEAVALVEQLFAAAAGLKLDEEQALRMAVQMEQQFIKVHANHVLWFNNQRLAKLFEELGKADEVHLDILRNCLKWWHTERRPLLRKQ